MSITPLSAARVTGELGLAGGTITGGTYAAHYGKQLGESGKRVNNYENDRRSIKTSIQNITSKISQAKVKVEELQDCMDVSKTPNRTWEQCISKGELAKQAMVELQNSAPNMEGYD